MPNEDPMQQARRSARRWRGRWLIALAFLGAACRDAEEARAQRSATPADTTFAATIARLSEPPGFFDTDNLISNEASYLHVVTRLRALGARGGAYIGVGPDQNYSYLAVVRPRIAFLVDVRRDNTLQHLMFKALFARSRNRMDFLARWLGRPVPGDLPAWDERPLEEIVAWIDDHPADSVTAEAERRAVVAHSAATGVPLTPADRETIARFHGDFIRQGLDLRFTSFRRLPRPHYPTLRQLVLAQDLDGRRASYLAREDDFRFVKSLHAADRIIPVVGNLGGEVALRAIAEELRRRGEQLTALYTSNVEYYLWGDGTFDAFARNVVALPRAADGVIIRSYFGRSFGGGHPLAVGGYASTQLLQPLEDFVRRHESGGWSSYWELVTRGAR